MNNHLSHLIVRHFHEMVKHQGRGITLNELRSLWLLDYTRNCRRFQVYRRMHSMSQVSRCDTRTKNSGPARWSSELITSVYICIRGLFWSLDSWIIKEKRKELRRYGVFFTCLASTAIRLEISHSPSTDSFINALRCFVCRRGPVRQLRSDQGTNFIRAKGELKDALSELDHEKITSEMVKNHFDWIIFKMNFAIASHMRAAAKDKFGQCVMFYQL